MPNQSVIVLDFGGQYNQLIARRVRECNVYCEVKPNTMTVDEIRAFDPIGIIFTGGPQSVYAEGSPQVDPEIFRLGIPILGICYGCQLMAQYLGGEVTAAGKDTAREYGKTQTWFDTDCRLFRGLPEQSITWMSHGDYMAKVPDSFRLVAHSDACPTVGICDEARGFYGVQFHPEVNHTEYGQAMLRNFLYEVCGATGDWTMGDFMRKSIEDIRAKVGDGKVLLALSGGLDSSLVSSVCAEELSKEGQTLSTYSFDFTDNSRYFKANDFQPSEDRPFVDIMKNYLKSEHQYLTCDNRSQADLLFASMKAHDLPCMADVDSSLLFFCREVSKQHKVVLTGECADEVFGGYPWFHRKNFLSCNTFPWTPDLSFRKSFLKDEIADALSLDSYVQSSYENAIAEVDILPSDNDTECSRRRISYLNIRYFMQTLLNRMDRTSMFSGLEARVPFADKNLVSYVFNVPWEMKAKDGLVKNLLRQCAKDYLPDTITFRKKSPYPKTYHPYYEQLLRQRLSTLLTTGESPLLALIDKEKTMQFLNQEGDYGKPWYGQLMAGPQMIAYLLQIHYWLSEYKIDLHL